MSLDARSDATVADRVARWRPSSPAAKPRWRIGPEWILAAVYFWISACMCAILGSGAFVGAFFVLVPTLGLIAASIYSSMATRATGEDATFLEDGESWIGQVWIVQNEIVTGVDRGVLWYDVGAIGFVGHRTSFIVSSTDVDPSYSIRVRLHGCYDSATDRYLLSLRTPEGQKWQRRNVYLYIRIFKPPPGYQTATPGMFSSRLVKFQHEQSNLTPQFPPLDIGPGSEKRWMLRLRALAPSVAVLSLVLATLAAIGTSYDSIWVLIVFVGMISLAIAKLTSRQRCRRLEALNGILADQYGDVDRLEGVLTFLDQSVDTLVRNLRRCLGLIARFVVGTASIGFALCLFVISVQYITLSWHGVLAGFSFLFGLYFLAIGLMLCVEACHTFVASRKSRLASDSDLVHWDF